MGAKEWRRHVWWGLLDRQPPERRGVERAWSPNRGSKARARAGRAHLHGQHIEISERGPH